MAIKIKISIFYMDNIIYLYNLTISNYIDNLVINDNPIFETLLINFISENKNILDSEITYKFIIYLHYELDTLFLKNVKKDSLEGYNEDFLTLSKDKYMLKCQTKKLAKKISDQYLKIKKLE